MSIRGERGFISRLYGNKRKDRELLRSADAARDARRWSEAVAGYAAVVKMNPGRADVWVQLGNCAKESRDYQRALQAYDAATELDGENADSFLQKGHLLKLMGDRAGAASCYRSSAFWGGDNNPAFAELTSLGETVANTQLALPIRVERGANDRPTIYIDITDLLDYLAVNTSLSGIQRVVANLVLNAETVMRRGASTIVPVLPDYHGAQVFAVGLARLIDLIRMVASGLAHRASLDQALGEMRQIKAAVRPVAGDTLVIPGAFWIFQRYDLMNNLRGQGVRVTVFIHDLIQVTNPEYVEPAATTVFRRSLVDMLCVSSHVMTNSEFVANEVRNYLKSRMNFTLPVIPITLATELGAEPTNTVGVHPEYREIVQEEYVLCVGTIEVRKNHFYLIKLWERLIAEFQGSIPNLIFVGKWGWEVDELKKHLSTSDDLGGRLFIFNGISDTDLSFLYKNCLFTIYPSFAEGWGLPVGESLGYGKPCVASKVTAIPEVGGGLCRYIDPFDLDDGYRVVSEILSDREGLRSWEAEINKRFKPKTWTEFSLELFDVVERAARDPSLDAPGNHCVLEVGEIAPFGHDALALLDAKGLPFVSARMGRLSGWHGLETWGCWASRRRAFLRFGTKLPAGEDVVVYLHLRTPEGDECADCSIKVGNVVQAVNGLGTVPQWVTTTGTVGANGFLDIVLISGKGFALRSNQGLYIGILAVAVAPISDVDARLRTLANIVPGGVPARVAAPKLLVAE